MDVLPSHLHIKGFLTQTASPTLLTDRLAGLAAEHVFVLDLIAVCLDPLDELIESDD